ncbi:hypothetical protein PAGA_b0007 [Pseudoalteromonas agarivorans DSM 14585]|uniref:Uncharacterized protein n=1 Tax=Pseudoalteromonas agarivorans DSM 14585 TaxID=1312369 RepID=A0ACA8E0K2_9GAMM|nr:hypothetical protein PAGA_b0007 [Pseudoalteromonas agarivorans DSM 14585]
MNNCSYHKLHVDFPDWLLNLVMIEPAPFKLAFFMPTF